MHFIHLFFISFCFEMEICLYKLGVGVEWLQERDVEQCKFQREFWFGHKTTYNNMIFFFFLDFTVLVGVSIKFEIWTNKRNGGERKVWKAKAETKRKKKKGHILLGYFLTRLVLLHIKLQNPTSLSWSLLYSIYYMYFI